MRNPLPPYAEWLIATRRQVGISQQRLADLTRLDRSHLSLIETGKTKLPTYETRQKIHHVLGTSEEDLVQAGIVRPEYSRVGNAVNEAPTAYEAEEGMEDLLGKAHALVDQVNPDYLGRVVAALELMSRAP